MRGIFSKPSPSTESPTFSQPCATSWHLAATVLKWGFSKRKTPCCWDTEGEREMWKEREGEGGNEEKRAMHWNSELQIKLTSFLTFWITLIIPEFRPLYDRSEEINVSFLCHHMLEHETSEAASLTCAEFNRWWWRVTSKKNVYSSATENSPE